MGWREAGVDSQRTAERVLADAGALAADAKRADLQVRLSEAHARIRRLTAVIVVIGDYKQGKSTFINAVVGQDVCPIDPDFATAVVTVVAYNDVAHAIVHRTVNGEATTSRIEISEAGKWIWERTNPGNKLGVDLVEILIPSAVLKAGFALVDSPGLGGFGRAQRQATLSFLRNADAFVYLADASSELSNLDLEFLSEAADLSPHGFHVLSKIDLYQGWRRIADLNRSHIAHRMKPLDVLPVSSVLRRVAIQRSNQALNAESGFVECMSRFGEVARERQRLASRAALAVVVDTMRQLDHGIDETLRLLDGGVEHEKTLETAVADLESFKSGASRWQTVLNDGITEIRAFSDYTIRQLSRSLVEVADELIEESDPAGEWQQTMDTLVAGIADDAASLFVTLETRATQLRDRLAQLLADTNAGAGLKDVALDPRAIWDDAGIEMDTSKPNVFATSFTAMRGAQSGIILLGLMGRFIGLASLLPVTIGVGLAFGVKQMLDERKRQLERRRQEAKKLARRFNDKVITELSRVVNDAIRELHRTLRDHTIDRITELQTTHTVAINEARQGLAQGQAQREQLEADLKSRRKRLSLIRTAALEILNSEDGP